MAAMRARSIFAAAVSFAGGAVAYKLWRGKLTDKGKVCTQERERTYIGVNA